MTAERKAFSGKSGPFGPGLHGACRAGAGPRWGWLPRTSGAVTVGEGLFSRWRWPGHGRSVGGSVGFSAGLSGPPGGAGTPSGSGLEAASDGERRSLSWTTLRRRRVIFWQQEGLPAGAGRCFDGSWRPRPDGSLATVRAAPQLLGRPSNPLTVVGGGLPPAGPLRAGGWS